MKVVNLINLFVPGIFADVIGSNRLLNNIKFHVDGRLQIKQEPDQLYQTIMKFYLAQKDSHERVNAVKTPKRRMKKINNQNVRLSNFRRAHRRIYTKTPTSS